MRQRRAARPEDGNWQPNPFGITGLLVDIDGTLHEAGVVIDGAAAALEELRGSLPLLYTTNTSRMPRRQVAAELNELGIPATEEEILTATVAAATWLRRAGIERVQLLAPAAVREDFAWLDVSDEHATRGIEAVVVADMGAGFTFGVLNAAFRSLRDGAVLVAIHRNRYWLTKEGPTLDAGPFVAALEYATGTDAVLVGKPAPTFFDMAASLLGVDRDGLVVVGDDPETDIAGAGASGLRAVRVCTGKSNAAQPAEAGQDETGETRLSAGWTIASIASIADLPAAVSGGIR